MAEDEAEDIGGISVSLGATHAQLISDIERANQIVEQWSKQRPTIVLGATGPATPGGGTAGPAAAVGGAAAATTGASESAVMAKLDRLASTLTAGSLRNARAEAEQVTINGVRVGGLSNLQSSLQKAITGTPVGQTAKNPQADLEETAQRINELRVETSQPIALSIPTEGAQTALSEVLATLKEIAATMQGIASTGLPTGTGAVPPTTPPTPAPRNPAAAVTKTPKPEVAATPEQKPAVAAATPTVREEPVQPTEQAQVVQPARRQQFVEAIASVQRGESPIDPDTGQPLTAISQEHALRSLRQRMNALGQAAPEAPTPPTPPVAAPPPRARVTATPTRAPAPPATATELTAAPGFVQPGPAQVGVSYSSGEFSADEEKERLREARSVRQQEVAAQAATRRQEREDRAQEKAQLRAVSRLPAPRPPSILDEPNQQAQYQALPASNTIANRPGYRTNEEQERERAVGSQPYQRTPEQQAAIDHARQQASQLPPQTTRAQQPAQPIDDIERRRRSQLHDLEEFGRGRGGATGLTDEDYIRRAEQRIATSESSSVARGRTARTTASSFGGQFLFGGPARQQAEAVARQSEAEQRLTLARRRLNDPAIIRDANAYRHATLEQTAAEENLAKATEKVRSFSGFGTAARSLAAVTVAGAAFGAGLKVIDFAISAIGPALGDAIDQAAGFGAVSNKVTQALAQQTLAAHGNVNAVLAQAEANAGLSSSAADALDNQLKLTTQVKAGAQAAGQAGGLFRAAIGTNQQVPQGLLGGYGGLGGGAVLGQQLGGGAGFAETIKSTFADFKDATAALQTNRVITPNTPTIGRQYLTATQQAGAETPLGQRPEDIARIAHDRTVYEDTLNQAAQRGAVALGAAGGAAARFTHITDDQAKSLQTSNLPQELKDLAKTSNEALVDSSGNLVTAFKDATDALEQAAAGLAIPTPQVYGRQATATERQREQFAPAEIPSLQLQQAFARPAQIAAVGRQTQYEVNTQQPVQAALSALANPNVPVGTGIAAQDQSRVAPQLKAAQGEQKQLNTYYQQGQDIIRETYDPAILQNFGQAAVTQFDSALASVVSTGKAIASISAGISNEQAAYQVAQYNFQLFIAKRTLGDIGGLTDHNFGAGESYLGVLERQNLLLGRQGQQLQFNLSQRQINFQTALAGFQAPGVTPEERQARIAEAKLEAGYSQKQLDIQRQMFGNQVKIVDIGNLRQGYDLAKQVALLTQGRRVTIDTAAAEQRLLRLQQLQAKNVAQVSSYLKAVDNLTSQAFGNIQQLETAAGHAVAGVAESVLRQFHLAIVGMTLQLGSFGQMTTVQQTQNYREHASGGVYDTMAPTRIGANGVMGEAGGEKLLILSHPKALDGGGMGGGVTNNFYISGNSVRNDNDLDVLVRKVTQALGKEASLKGLRGIG